MMAKDKTHDPTLHIIYPAPPFFIPTAALNPPTTENKLKTAKEKMSQMTPNHENSFRADCLVN